jgi:hypothetical protein
MKTMRLSLNQVWQADPPPVIIPRGHSFRTLTVDQRYLHGCVCYAILGAYDVASVRLEASPLDDTTLGPASGAQILTVSPGVPLPLLRGEEVRLVIAPAGGLWYGPEYSIAVPDGLPIVLWLGEDGDAYVPSDARRWSYGDPVVRIFNDSSILTRSSPEQGTIIRSDWLNEAQHSPLYVRMQLRGGDRGTTLAAAQPCWLVLATSYNSDDTAQVLRCWPFPGAGQGLVGFALPTIVRTQRTTGPDWRLYVVKDPDGNPGEDPRVEGLVYYGHGPDFARYSCELTVEDPTAGTYPRSWAGMSNPGLPTSLVHKITTENEDEQTIEIFAMVPRPLGGLDEGLTVAESNHYGDTAAPTKAQVYVTRYYQATMAWTDKYAANATMTVMHAASTDG